ncbi:hypothetical protein B0H11DRAFT_1919532 [Mycena galericulata]|nr:hypothetical protein B0H11DRAFT_1919532 [Mycena galericulata]
MSGNDHDTWPASAMLSFKPLASTLEELLLVRTSISVEEYVQLLFPIQAFNCSRRPGGIIRGFPDECTGCRCTVANMAQTTSCTTTTGKATAAAGQTRSCFNGTQHLLKQLRKSAEHRRQSLYGGHRNGDGREILLPAMHGGVEVGVNLGLCTHLPQHHLRSKSGTIASLIEFEAEIQQEKNTQMRMLAGSSPSRVERGAGFDLEVAELDRNPSVDGSDPGGESG